MPGDAVAAGPDGRPRCFWAVGGAPEYIGYHDEEWGRPVLDDDRLFERLTLEAFQSGLSWLTILRKREGFRRAFAGFDPDVVAGFTPADQARLLADTGIVRNRAKVAAAVRNAAATVRLRADGGLDALVWSFAPVPPPRRPRAPGDVAATTPASVALARSLKAHGFAFVGPTTAHAAMQACGLVDEHLEGCHVAPR